MDVCKFCGSESVEMRQKGPHTGVYCCTCNKWLGWVKHSTQVVANNNTEPVTVNGSAGEGCKYCGSLETELRESGPHTGVYCCTCGKWLNWVKGKPKAQKCITKPQNSASDAVVIKGTERLKLFLAATGDLTLTLDEQNTLIHQVDALQLPKRVIVTVGAQQLEVPLGESVNVYIV